MWHSAFLLLAASLSVSLARPRFTPLSSEMVNYINKVNTTWKVSYFISFFLFFIFLLDLISLLSRRLVTTSIMLTTVMSRDSVGRC